VPDQHEQEQLALINSFIDEIHTILRAGAVEGGALDAGNILKPALARGDLRVIGATTPDEYRQYIAQDAALERRFQPVWVSEPTPEEALDILRGVKGCYETHHNVAIADDALQPLCNSPSAGCPTAIYLTRHSTCWTKRALALAFPPSAPLLT
jgi:ATP-dependent Clp protease ATP-binding subunit ClpA